MPAEPAPSAVPAAPPPTATGSPARRWAPWGAVALAVLSAAALLFAYTTQQRVRALEAELVKRQADSGTQVAEARLMARQAEQASRETAAKLALLEARVAETALQRTQIEELMQGLARSRDENVLADIDAALRVALQQSAITGSAEPLVATLRQADERLARFNQPRLERVRRAVAADLERVRSAGITDFTGLAIRIDDLIRQVDELPMLAMPHQRGVPTAGQPAAAASAPAGADLATRWRQLGLVLWSEARSLVRVTRVDSAEAVLLAPEQALYLRENLKLRLLNARLALLARQFEVAAADLREAQSLLDRWFDRGARRVAVAGAALREVAAQSRQVVVPRPDATLAAIATLSAVPAPR
ncbi:MAG: uroporphyrinogen-III C-methyltransferase [Betaproteobacteria bacterium]